MTASELSLEWGELEGLLETLFDACLMFDAPRIRELLVKAPLGYQPQSELADLVWEEQRPGQEKELLRQEPESGSTAREQKVVALTPKPTSAAS